MAYDVCTPAPPSEIVTHIQGIGNNATFTDDASKSIAVHFGEGVIPIAIAVGSFHACAITNGPGKTKGNLYCWGDNEYAQLGIPTAQVLVRILLACIRMY
jgi:alpha-tubulin suppressor-like RCC1 family protein